MIAHYLQGKSHNARAMLNEHQLAGDMASVGPEKLRQWVALFKDSALPLVEEIEAARAMNDDVNIKRLAHKLKRLRQPGDDAGNRSLSGAGIATA